MVRFEPVDPKVNFPELERRILRFWDEADIFAKSLKAREGAPEWVFYEGPPTANGKPVELGWRRRSEPGPSGTSRRSASRRSTGCAASRSPDTSMTGNDSPSGWGSGSTRRTPTGP